MAESFSVQTRRDQLQAYRFQNRRALAALVTGQPNVLEPPMRRLTVTTLSGIMIAILIAIVFGALAVIHPTAGTSWETEGAVVVDSDNNSTYLYTKGALHPVLNYTSAVLASGATSEVTPVKVSSSDISNATYSYEIGIPDVPYSLPSPSSLLRYPMSACSVQRQHGLHTVTRVTLHIDAGGGTRAVPADQGVLVATPEAPQREWLLFGGERMLIPSAQVASALGYSSPVLVGSAFLTSVPQGVDLAPPMIPGRGTPARQAIAGTTPSVGTVLKTPAGGYLVLSQGTVPLTALEFDLFAGSPSVSVTKAQADLAAFTPPSPDANPLSVFTGLPATPPTIDPGAQAGAGACATYTDGTDDPSFVLPPPASDSPDSTGTVIDSAHSNTGTADTVDVPATKGVLATPADAPHTVLIISDQGIRFSFQNADLIAAFGYSASDVVHMPAQLLALVPRGPEGTGLSTSAALQRSGN